MKITLNDLEENISDLSTSYFDLTSIQKCDALLCCIQKALRKHPDWTMVFDNIHLNTPKELKDIIVKWFVQNDLKNNWSQGTIIFIVEGMTENVIQLNNECKYYMNKGYVLLGFQVPL